MIPKIKALLDITQSALESINTKIGATEDTGGSASAGSIMAKLNGIFTNTARFTSARATKIDNIGATGDTGGTATAGTVMGKLNAIISGLATVGNNANSSADITAIKTATAVNNTASTTGTLSQKISSAIANTATNNTENKTGILSQKLSYLINRATKVVTPSNTSLKQLSGSGSLSVASTDNGRVSAKTATSSWTGYGYIQVPGIYRISCTFNTTITTDKGDGKNTATLEIQYVSISTGATTTKTLSLMSTSSALGSTTKTIDLPFAVGDMVRCRITIKNGPYYQECVADVGGDAFTFNWTDISLRGTLTEITTNAVR